MPEKISISLLQTEPEINLQENLEVAEKLFNVDEIIDQLRKFKPEDDLKGLFESLQQMNIEEFKEFLDRFKELGSIKSRLPQNFYEGFLKTSFYLVKSLNKESAVTEETDEAESHFIEYDEDGNIILPGDDLLVKINEVLASESKTKNNELSPAEKTFLALQEIYESNSEAADKFFDIFAKYEDNIRPEVFLQGIYRAHQRPELHEAFWHKRILERDLFVLLKKDKGSEYQRLIQEKINFDNPETFSDTGQWLKILGKMDLEVRSTFIIDMPGLEDQPTGYVSRQERSEYYAPLIEIKNYLEQKIETGQGSYLLNKLAEIVFHNMNSDKQAGSTLNELRSHFFTEPGKLSPEQQVFFRQGKLIISDVKGTHQLKADDLSILPRQDNDPQQQRLNDYQLMISDEMSYIIKRDFGVQLKDLSLPVQAYFLDLIRSRSAEDVEPVKQFVRQYGQDALVTFLSLEHGGQAIGDKILEIGNKLEPATAELIFNKYGRLVNLVDDLEQKLKRFEEKNQKNIQQIDVAEHILKKAKDLLLKYTDRLGAGKELGYEEVKEEMENVSEEIILFAGIFKVLAKQDSELFNNLPDTELTIIKAEEIKDDEKKSMLEIFVKNRVGYSPNLMKKTKQDFLEILETPGNIFYILKHDGKIVSFLRTEQLGKNRLLFASFNVRPEAIGSAIGNAMLKTVVDELAKNNTIELSVYVKNPVFRHYLMNSKFRINGIDLDYHGSGEAFFSMIRDDGRDNEFRGLSMSDQEIILLSYNQNMVPANFQIFKFKNSEFIDQLVEAKKKIEDGNWLITRYVLDGEGYAYFVLEKSDLVAHEMAA